MREGGGNYFIAVANKTLFLAQEGPPLMKDRGPGCDHINLHTTTYQISKAALTILFDNILLCNYGIISKVLLEYQYYIFLKISHNIDNGVFTVNCF